MRFTDVTFGKEEPRPVLLNFDCTLDSLMPAPYAQSLVYLFWDAAWAWQGLKVPQLIIMCN